jgi:hypothetical protein
LRSEFPEGVYQEAYGYLLTHYAIRALMHDAAVEATSSAGAGVLGSELIVPGRQGTAIVDRITRLRVDLQGAQWRTEAMFVPRHGIELAPYQGRLRACGGATKTGPGAVADCTSIGRS